MIDWIFTFRQNGKIRCLCENENHPVIIVMEHYKALDLLKQNKARISDKYPGFPITMDGKHYFEGEYRAIE